MITPLGCREFIGLIVATALALPGNAQTPPPIDDVAHVSVELDSGWTLETAIVNGELVGFFAWIPEAEVTPGNVYLAWLEHVGGGAWAMYGWDTGDAANAVAAIEQELSDSSALDGVDTFGIDGSVLLLDNCDPGVQPGGQGGTAMPSGVTTTDPAAPLMEALADDPVVAPTIASALASSGASVAPGLSQQLLSAALCPGNSQLDVVLNKSVELILQESSMTFVEHPSTLTLLLAGCGGFCWPSEHHFYGPWSSWSCDSGPTYSNFGSTCATCLWGDCTRSRTHRSVIIGWDCNGVVENHPPDTDHEAVVSCPVPSNLAQCPTQPPC